MKERRIGKVTVHRRLLLSAIDGGGGANLFHGSVPLDIQSDWTSDRTTFVLWHPDFDPIKEGEVAPEYIATFTPDSVYPTWNRVQK